jgi:hypothetical protein
VTRRLVVRHADDPGIRRRPSRWLPDDAGIIDDVADVDVGADGGLRRPEIAEDGGQGTTGGEVHPWSAVGAGAVTVLLGLCWLIAHLPARGVGMLVLPGSDRAGRLLVDPGSPAGVLAGTPGIRSAHSKVVRDRGELVVALTGTIDPRADLTEEPDLRQLLTAPADTAGPPSRVTSFRLNGVLGPEAIYVAVAGGETAPSAAPRKQATRRSGSPVSATSTQPSGRLACSVARTSAKSTAP